MVIAFYHSDKSLERSVDHLYAVSDFHIEIDNDLFETQPSDLVLVERPCLALRTDKAGDAAAGICQHIPQLGGVNQLYENVTRHRLVFHRFLFAVLFLYGLLGRDFYVENLFLKIVVFNHLFQICLDYIFISRIGVQNIPLGFLVFAHFPPIFTTRP